MYVIEEILHLMVVRNILFLKHLFIHLRSNSHIINGLVDKNVIIRIHQRKFLHSQASSESEACPPPEPRRRGDGTAEFRWPSDLILCIRLMICGGLTTPIDLDFSGGPAPQCILSPIASSTIAKQKVSTTSSMDRRLAC